MTSAVPPDDSGQPDLPPSIVALVRELGAMPGVTAVAVSGSSATGFADDISDVDLNVYGQEPPIELRADLAKRYGADAEPIEVGNQAFGSGDEWTDAASGIGVDLMYWHPDWIEEQLSRVLDQHLPSVGYSTCFWRTVLQSRPLIDPTGWFAALQTRARAPYPEPLRRAIIANNQPLLRDARSSFLHQLQRAIAREDPISVAHRTSALLASFFDILFALNRVPHPGEKRLLAFASRECPRRPANLDALVTDLIAAIPPPWNLDDITARAHALIDPLDALIAEM